MSAWSFIDDNIEDKRVMNEYIMITRTKR